MPTCLEIQSALDTLASAITNPNIVDDLSGLTASLSLPYGDIAFVELTAGGTATLSVPSGFPIDGKPFWLTVSGHVSSTNPQSSNDPTVRVILGTTLGITPAVGIASPNLTATGTSSFFYLRIGMLWDSVTESLMFGTSYPNSLTAGFGSANLTVAAQTDLQFSLVGAVSGAASDPEDTLTISTFSLELV